MKFEENKVYHIYNRGNNQQRIFFDDENYKFFLKKIQTALRSHSELLAYCLMPNHFHLLIYIKHEIVLNKLGKEKSLNDNLGIMLRSYTRALQLERDFKGSLFQQKLRPRKLLERMIF